MYQPNTFDIDRLKERAKQFKDQLVRHKKGISTSAEFRPLRLQNGLYIQRHAPMLRIAIAYGMLNSKQLRKLGRIAEKFDRGYGHLTTRQNMQLNWIAVDDVPKALDELADVGHSTSECYCDHRHQLFCCPPCPLQPTLTCKI